MPTVLLLLSLAPASALRLAPAKTPAARSVLARVLRAPAMASESKPVSAIETVTSRPARAVMAAMWLFLIPYIATASPGDFLAESDTLLIQAAIENTSSLNPIFFAVFNALGLLPAVNGALLLPGAKGQSPLPTAPFVLASFALGFGAIGPYLSLRQPRPFPVARSELGLFTRYVTESRLFGLGLVAASLVLSAAFAAGLSDSSAVREYAELFATSKLVHVSTIDLAVLSVFAFEPIREDMCRRGWWDEAEASPKQTAQLLAFSLVPVLGPCAYILLRPALEE